MEYYLIYFSATACCAMFAILLRLAHRLKQSEARCQIALEMSAQAMARLTLIEKTIPTLKETSDPA